MKKILLFLFILSSFAINAQETWNSCNSTVNTIPAPSYDSTFVLEAPSRAALAKGMANWVPATSSMASYKVYAALLTQSGTDAPVATVYNNTLGGTVVWTRASTGIFKATLSGAFPSATTHIILSNSVYYNGLEPVYASATPDDEASGNFIYVVNYKLSDASTIDGISGNGIYIEIKVYNQ